ncbi:MAG: 4'-phosphopantetheinyl transferase superfamily protein [Bacteroidota bacterium]
MHVKELEHASTLKFDRRKHSYLLGRVSAKMAINELVTDQSADSIFTEYGIFQFPVVKNVHNSNIQVSISHCDNIGISVAFPEEHPLGIDIEKVEDKIVETLDRQLTEEEKTLLRKNNLFTDYGHTLLWTVKEGLSKIFRTGLMMDFKALEINTVELKDGIYESHYSTCAQYKALSIFADQYVCSMVVPKNTTIDLTTFWGQLKGALDTTS